MKPKFIENTMIRKFTELQAMRAVYILCKLIFFFFNMSSKLGPANIMPSLVILAHNMTSIKMHANIMSSHSAIQGTSLMAVRDARCGRLLSARLGKLLVQSH